jgi:hypothetical protein
MKEVKIMTQANQYEAVYEGDWVSGSSAADEKFIGYIESFDESSQVLVHVTQSDHEEIINTSIEASRLKIKKLLDRGPATREEVMSLIDLALMTHDKEWFEQLEHQLASPKFAKPMRVTSAAGPAHMRWNSLGTSRNRLN